MTQALNVYVINGNRIFDNPAKKAKKPPGNFRAAYGISMLLSAYFFLETRYATGDAM